jgi:hypothetical protein
MLRMAMIRLEETLAQKYRPAIPRVRNLTWALLIQALFNDPHLREYLDDYGGSLRKESTFGDIVKRLTAGKIAPILRELIDDSAYTEKVAAGKYDFLRTSEAFKKSMTIASGRLRWSKKSF